MKDLARRGAQSRLAELVAEMDSILEAFPGLGRAPARPAAASKGRRRKLSEETKAKMRASWARRKAGAGADGSAAVSEPAPEKKKRTMSAAARARISAAQKKRWAARKAGKKR
jgi:hypothetical protein